MSYVQNILVDKTQKAREYKFSGFLFNGLQI